MAEERRKKIVSLLKETRTAVSATTLAQKLKVSRQVIVGDVALLRAEGEHILATPRGYIYDTSQTDPNYGYEGVIACKHTFDQLKDELYTIVDFGGTVIDVTIEHSLYGQLSGSLDLSSRYDVDLFLQNVAGDHDKPLSMLTGGIHLHRIGCRDADTFKRIQRSLSKQQILFKS